MLWLAEILPAAYALLRFNGDNAGDENACEVTDDHATILVVEDDRVLLSVIKYDLERERYRVLTASHAVTALDLARAYHDIDVILLDIMLPGVDGLALLPQLRQFTIASVLIVSARGEVQDRIDGLDLGADDYIAKPFVLQELLARVRAAVRRRSCHAAELPAMLQRGPVRIEPERRTAFVHDTPLKLRPKEFGLLLTLALEPDKVFTRNELLDRVWGQDVIIDDRTVDVHMSWLRGKLAAAGAPAGMIQTVCGTGYRMERDRAAALAKTGRAAESNPISSPARRPRGGRDVPTASRRRSDGAAARGIQAPRGRQERRRRRTARSPRS